MSLDTSNILKFSQNGRFLTADVPNVWLWGSKLWWSEGQLVSSLIGYQLYPMSNYAPLTAVCYKWYLSCTPISAAKFPKSVLFTNRFRWNFAERFLGSKNETYQISFSKLVLLPVLRVTSGLGLFFKYLQIKIFYFASLELRSLEGIWGHLGSKSQHFQTR